MTTDYQPDEIEDQFGVVRRCGSMPSKPPSDSGLVAFASAFPVWTLDECRRAIAAKTWKAADLFPGEGEENQGSHGCHDDKTEVLTASGWKSWSDYNGTDLLATSNPETHELEFQAPLQNHAYEYDGPLFFSNNRSVDFALTPNHRMYVRKWSEPKRTLESGYRFTEIQKLGWYAGLPATTRGFRGVEIERINVGGREFLGDDFVAMISLIISDGWAGGSENLKNQVSFCCFNQDRYPMVAALANRIGFGEIPGRTGVWIRTDAALAKWCRANLYCGSEYRAWNKRIPDIIKTVEEHQLRHFIEYYGDKNHGSDASEVYYTSSKRLADDWQELLLKVGKRSTIAARAPRSAVMKDGREVNSNRDQYEIRAWESDALSIERKKGLGQDRYKGIVYCATVPNGTLVTRRNGTVLISGNSCNGYALANASWRAAYAGGNTKLTKRSGSYAYSLMNGGRDQGSMLYDGFTVGQQYGLPSATSCPWNLIYRNDTRRFDTEAALFKVDAPLLIHSWDELITAWAGPFFTVIAVQVGRNFERLQGDVLGVDQGGGNHAVCQSDVRVTDSGEIQAKIIMDWGLQHGVKGCGWLGKEHVRQSMLGHQFYAIPIGQHGAGTVK